MKKRIICLLIILAMLLIGIIPVQAQEVDPLVEQAITLYDAEDYDAAVPLLIEAADKGNAEAQNALANCSYYGRESSRTGRRRLSGM